MIKGKNMSNCKIIQKDKQEENNSIYNDDIDFQYFKKNRLLFDFKFYTIRTYGSETWKSLLENYEFYNLYTNIGLTYGEVVFYDIVNTLIDYLGANLKNIISYFTEFRKTIEFLSYEDIRRHIEFTL